MVLESCGYGNDVEDYARLTSVQVGAGKGPDILCGSELLQDYISGMMEKGALEELNLYMEASGIRDAACASTRVYSPRYSESCRR